MGRAALLPAAVGTRRAKEVALTGRFVTAAEARDYGLVAEVVAPDALLDAAVVLAQRITAAPPETVRRLLRTYDEGDGLDRAERMALERRTLLGSELDVSGAVTWRQELGRRRDGG